MRVASFTLVGLIALVPACARRTDARARDAFNSARGAGAGGDGRREVRGGGGGGGTFDRDKIGWDRVSEVVENAVGILRSSPDDEHFAEIAMQWCKVEPEPRNTPDGVVRVCNPEPPVVADGTPFSLEMGGEGVIGLVASDLTQADSERIVLDAREAARRFCTEPFRSSTRNLEPEEPAEREDDAQTPGPREHRRSGAPRGRGAPHEFHVCAAQGGPLLAISRFPRTPGSPRWMVTVTVLSPG